MQSLEHVPLLRNLLCISDNHLSEYPCCRSPADLMREWPFSLMPHTACSGSSGNKTDCVCKTVLVCSREVKKKKTLKSTWNIHISSNNDGKVTVIFCPPAVYSRMGKIRCAWCRCCVSVHQWKREIHLAQILVQPLVCSSEKSSDREAVRVLFIYDLRLLQQRVEFLPDLGLDHVLRGSVRLDGEKNEGCKRNRNTGAFLAKQAISAF